MLACLSLLNSFVKPHYSGSEGIIVNMIKEELLSNETVASFLFSMVEPLFFLFLFDHVERGRVDLARDDQYTQPWLARLWWST